MAERARSLAALTLLILLVGPAIIGCTGTTRLLSAGEASLRGGIPVASGLAFGRIRVDWRSTPILWDSRTNVEFRNEATNERLVHRLEPNGDYFLLLPSGRYTVASVWSGFQRIDAPTEGGIAIHFIIPPGSPIYLGTLSIRSPSPIHTRLAPSPVQERLGPSGEVLYLGMMVVRPVSGEADVSGEIALLDEFEAAFRRLKARYPNLPLHEPPMKGLMFASPREGKRADGAEY